jgi:epoxide hydrolase-like predicted phosphatase
MRFAVALLAAGIALGAARGEPARKTATVEADGIAVASGPAFSFPAVGQLKKGDSVIVVREEETGFLAIIPPAGSVSWVKQIQVGKLDGLETGKANVPVMVDGAEVMAAIAEAGVARPIMLEAIRRIRARSLRVGALTNNWRREGPEDDVIPHALRSHFDVFIESRVVGLRKPDPRIYELACRELGVEPARTAFLDDIGTNLKPARALGMSTIKVTDPHQALRDLSALLGIDLLV